MKKQPGRPRLPSDEKRDARVDLRLTQDENARLTERAEADGVSVSVWAREAVLRALRRKKK